MRLRKQRPAPASSPQKTATKPPEPSWQKFLDTEERPSREDLAADHDVFLDSILEPVPMPRWLRGRRRARQDKLSSERRGAR